MSHSINIIYNTLIRKKIDQKRAEMAEVVSKKYARTGVAHFKVWKLQWHFSKSHELVAFIQLTPKNDTPSDQK
jgi:hypothetical protein